ncbi:MAG TPA: tail fiber domain-containing protein [Longimicrobium sp.]|jgi:hypothetical protein
MKVRHSALALALVVASAASTALHAQATDSALAVSYGGQSLFRVNNNGSAFFGGTYNSGATNGAPTSGAGTRMFWYPGKAAFRAGGINGTQWDDANIGLYSTAFGQDVRALGDNALAVGNRAVAANTGTIAMGEDVTATGAYSVVFGYKASSSTKAGSPRLGAFVFGDRSTTTDTIHAEVTNSAMWRVANGFRIYTASDRSTGVTFQSGTATSNWNQSNAVISTSTGAYLSTAGIWTNTSDVNRKHLFRSMEGEDVLARLRTLPIQTWSYRVEDSSVRHLGPTAQDFSAAFGLGNDDKVIGTVDADGVALAAAQALDRRSVQQQAEIEKLRAENRALAERLARIEALLAAPKQDR